MKKYHNERHSRKEKREKERMKMWFYLLRCCLDVRCCSDNCKWVMGCADFMGILPDWDWPILRADAQHVGWWPDNYHMRNGKEEDDSLGGYGGTSERIEVECQNINWWEQIKRKINQRGKIEERKHKDKKRKKEELWGIKDRMVRRENK